ncbi:hypothetical protein HK097_000978 [Rhizophlyctis rosea]|uniref:Uncharacterized protein n=1 Tax=Rhizophlyctis rosea TaxID=64517 RepID=A0AAD5SJ86_9FUNG|nr:hypothetical protein HK097_000978 [Rhizophlyctis rosea]
MPNLPLLVGPTMNSPNDSNDLLEELRAAALGDMSFPQIPSTSGSHSTGSSIENDHLPSENVNGPSPLVDIDMEDFLDFESDLADDSQTNLSGEITRSTKTTQFQQDHHQQLPSSQITNASLSSLSTPGQAYDNVPANMALDPAILAGMQQIQTLLQALVLLPGLRNFDNVANLAVTMYHTVSRMIEHGDFASLQLHLQNQPAQVLAQPEAHTGGTVMHMIVERVVNGKQYGWSADLDAVIEILLKAGLKLSATRIKFNNDKNTNVLHMLTDDDSYFNDEETLVEVEDKKLSFCKLAFDYMRDDFLDASWMKTKRGFHPTHTCVYRGFNKLFNFIRSKNLTCGREDLLFTPTNVNASVAHIATALPNAMFLSMLYKCIDGVQNPADADTLRALFSQREARFDLNAHGMAKRMEEWKAGNRGRRIRAVVEEMEAKGLAL